MVKELIYFLDQLHYFFLKKNRHSTRNNVDFWLRNTLLWKLFLDLVLNLVLPRTVCLFISTVHMQNFQKQTKLYDFRH